MTPYTYLDARDALATLPKTSRVVVTWYSKSRGQRTCAGKVISVKRKSMKVRIWPPVDKSKIIQLKLSDYELRNGSLSYWLRLPLNAKEAESVAKFESRYLKEKLGWRYTAALRHAVLANWQHWAQMRYDREHHYEQLTDWRYRASIRLEEMLRCGR